MPRSRTELGTFTAYTWFDAVEQFWSRVKKTEDCWLWIGPCTPSGYGNYINQHLGNTRTHRIAYELLKGPIPPNMTLDHLCRVRNCVNPDHLEVVSAKVNNERGNSPSAINMRKDQCVHGHSLQGDNLYITPDKRRQCRACQKERMKRYKQRKETVTL